MAIELVTGLPGNAKTLYTIAYVKAWAEKEKRPVFYHGIPELTLDWQQIEPTEWANCPPGSIIVIDEAQKTFRNRSLGAVPPPFVQDLETHRHKGIDLVFITQHPTLIDPAVRKLTQKHRHLVRVWGMEVSTVHTWHAVRDNCDKPAARKDSEKQKWAFDKSVYKLYKSAEQHTMKRSIPMRVKLLALVPILLAAAGYYVYQTMLGKKKPEPVPITSPQTMMATSTIPAVQMQGAEAPIDPIEDAKRYVHENTPRIAGLPHTAPKYDELTRPTKVPVPAMCIQRAEKCACYTQQGTPMDVQYNMCIGFARNGYFQDFDADQDRADTNRVANSSRILDDRIASHGPSEATVIPAPVYVSQVGLPRAK